MSSTVGIKVTRAVVGGHGATAVGIFLRDSEDHKRGDEAAGAFDRLEDGKRASTLLSEDETVVALFDTDRGTIVYLSDADLWKPELADLKAVPS